MLVSSDFEANEIEGYGFHERSAELRRGGRLERRDGEDERPGASRAPTDTSLDGGGAGPTGSETGGRALRPGSSGRRRRPLRARSTGLLHAHRVQTATSMRRPVPGEK